MPDAFARKAIDRAVGSVARGGSLDVGFFGGEPLLEAAPILEWMAYARSAAERAQIDVSFSLTTNGTLADGAAWSVLTVRASPWPSATTVFPKCTIAGSTTTAVSSPSSWW